MHYQGPTGLDLTSANERSAIGKEGRGHRGASQVAGAQQTILGLQHGVGSSVWSRVDGDFDVLEL